MSSSIHVEEVEGLVNSGDYELALKKIEELDYIEEDASTSIELNIIESKVHRLRGDCQFALEQLRFAKSSSFQIRRLDLQAKALIEEGYCLWLMEKNALALETLNQAEDCLNQLENPSEHTDIKNTIDHVIMVIKNRT